jgi:hypothetical protein
MKEWKYLVYILCMSSFMSIYFIKYIYVQEKFNIMKNNKIRGLLIQI